MAVVSLKEKQYENAANIELGLHHPAVFPPDQVLEAVLGYDVAAHQPSDAPIWKLLSINAPNGIVLTPNLWQRARCQPKPADLPSEYVSLIFQYKRPEQITRATGKQWSMWNTSYFRFEVTPHQHLILNHLETSIQNKVVVRYVSPAFATYKELQQLQLERNVLAKSAFASPGDIGHHQVWTYNSEGTMGCGNPIGQICDLRPFKHIWMDLARRRKETLFEHLRGLTEGLPPAGLFEMAFDAQLLTELQQDMSDQQIQGVMDVLAISDTVANSGASWFVLDLDCS